MKTSVNIVALLAASIGFTATSINGFTIIPPPAFQHNVVQRNNIALSATSSNNNDNKMMKIQKPNFEKMGQKVGSTFAALILTINALAPVQMAFAEGGSRPVGAIAGSGLVFKDTLVIEGFDDPKVQGVSLYISNFQRPLTERLQKDFFSDPSFASVGCAKTGPVKIADNIKLGPQGEEVFEENRSLLFKQLRVQRIYDQEKNTVVYVSFNTRLDKNSDDNKSRFKSSICVVNLD